MNKKILLVDDDPRIRAMLSMTLNKAYTIIEAGNGLQGLSLAAKESPDMIFLDVQMPVMDGFEVCRRLKGDPSTAGIKVVMLTGLASDDDKDRGRAAGADDYFTKPFSPRALLLKVNQVLETH